MPNLDTVQRDIAYSVSNKGSGRAFSIIRDNMDYIYEGKRYDIHKKQPIMSYEEIEQLSPDYVILSDYYDIGKGELDYITPRDFYIKRYDMRKRINERYIKVFQINPTYGGYVNCCMLNRDYVVFRNIKWSQVKDCINGPAIQIFKKKDAGI